MHIYYSTRYRNRNNIRTYDLYVYTNIQAHNTIPISIPDMFHCQIHSSRRPCETTSTCHRIHRHKHMHTYYIGGIYSITMIYNRIEETIYWQPDRCRSQYSSANNNKYRTWWWQLESLLTRPTQCENKRIESGGTTHKSLFRLPASTTSRWDTFRHPSVLS